MAPSAVPFDGKIWKVDPATGVGAMTNSPMPRALTTDVAQTQGLTRVLRIVVIHPEYGPSLTFRTELTRCRHAVPAARGPRFVLY